MATNIGNLNFGIDANTKGLRNAIAKLNEFRKTVDSVSKSQKKGSEKATAALVRQESAIKKAFQATLRLRQAQQKAGSGDAQLRKTTNAFRILTTEMTSGVLKQKEFTRSMDAFSAKTGKAQRAIKDLQKAGSGKGLSNMTRTLRNLESASVLAVGPLSGLGARIRSLGAIAGRSTLFLVGMFAAITAGLVAFAKLAKAAVNASRVFETSMARFEAASGSIKIARKEMAFVIKTSTELGLRIDTSAKAFSRLAAATRGTSLEGQGVRKIFLAVSKAAAALRLGAGEVEGTFRAIEQIMSKGSVQAEELRGQLGERLPGAFRLAAESMGVTTAALGKMLKNGEVLADDFLPRFAVALEKAFADKALDNVNSFQGSMNLLANEALLFSRAFDQASGISRAFIFSIQKLTGAIGFFREQLNNIIAALGGVIAGMIVLSGSKILKGLKAAALAIRGMAIATIGLNIALAANPLVALGGALVRIAIFTSVAIATFFGLKAIMDDGTEAISDMDSALDDLTDKTPEIGVLAGKFKVLSDSIDDAVAEMKLIAEVTSFMDRFGADDVEGLTLRFELLAKAGKLTQKEMSALAGTFISIGFGPTAADVEGISLALFQLFGALRVARFEQEKFAKSASTIKDALEEITDLELRLQAVLQGQVAVDLFDDVTSAVNDLRKEFLEFGDLTEEQIMLLARLEAVLLSTKAATDALTKAEKDRKKELREAASAAKRFEKQVEKSEQKIRVLRQRLIELAKGPDSFEFFTKVTEKVEAYRFALEQLSKDQVRINRLVAEYTELLTEQARLTDRFARMGEAMASSVVKALEDIIVVGGSVKDMLRDLGQELLRLFIRAAFLDTLRAQLGSVFRNFLFPGAAGGGGGGSGGPPSFPGGGPTLAHGGSFTIGGSGGSDRPVTFFGKPGEIVDVRRRDQPTTAGGGGSINITINAPGADAGTVARIKEIVRVEMVPSIIQASTDNTIARLRRPKFA